MTENQKSLCYDVHENKIFGRYLVANQDIKEGQIILQERALVIGAPIQASSICFKCCRRLKTNVQICSGCGTATVCSKTCTGTFHNQQECLTLKQKSLAPQILMQNSQMVLPLRCLLLRDYSPEIWKRLVQLEPHLSRRRDTWIWRMHKLNVERVLQESGLLNPDDIKDEIAQIVCGILDVNAFEVRPVECGNLVQGMNPGECLRALFLEAALMAHDCVGNTHLAVDDSFCITVRASRFIANGETVFFNYTNALLGSEERRQHLREGKYFDCNCQRCLDPTELGTEMSTLVCTRCRKSSLKNCEDTWRCLECSHTYSSFLIRTTIGEARRRLDAINVLDINEMEKLLNIFLLTFGRRHYMVIELKQALASSYAQNVHSIKGLKRQTILCKELLEVFKVVEPGISRLQAVMCYELQRAELELAERQFSVKEISRQDYNNVLLGVEVSLKESIKFLLYEPQNSPEGRLRQQAMHELKELRQLITQMNLSEPKNVRSAKKKSKRNR